MLFVRDTRTSGRRSIALLGATIAMVCASAFAALPASAHSGSLFFHETWSQAQRGAVSIYAESSLSGAALSRVLAGAKTWENTRRSLDFTWNGTKNLSHDPCDLATRGRNLVAMGKLDGRGKNLGMTTVCMSGGSIVRFVMIFDSAEDWYTGTSTNLPRGRPDLWSVATHEFGHAIGWGGHFDDPTIALGTGICGNFTGQHTMCKTHYSGTARQRTLGPHDIDTFSVVY
jgi:hypothetical protein